MTTCNYWPAEGMTPLDFKRLQRCIGARATKSAPRDEPIYELGPRKALLIGNLYADENVHLLDRLRRLYTPGADVDELERVIVRVLQLCHYKISLGNTKTFSPTPRPCTIVSTVTMKCAECTVLKHFRTKLLYACEVSIVD